MIANNQQPAAVRIQRRLQATCRLSAAVPSFTVLTRQGERIGLCAQDEAFHHEGKNTILVDPDQHHAPPEEMRLLSVDPVRGTVTVEQMR